MELIAPSLKSHAREARPRASSGLRVPTYDRSSLQPAIVHIGLGAFHRSHQAVYLDELADAGHSGWGIVAASLRRRNAVDALNAQRRLFTVLECDGPQESARLIGSIVEALFVPDDPEALMARLSDERTKLVTLTITGDAYHPGGKIWLLLADALRRRRRAGVDPFAILSCDNLPRNGEAARSSLVASAALRDEVLARFIESNVSFPSSMVDRITPDPSADTRAHMRRAYGVDDLCAVMAERHRAWIIEDQFAGQRPPLEEVGAQMVSDVRPYATMKSRMLNGGHSALVYLAMLAGFRWTDEAMGDGIIGWFLERLLSDEIAPLLEVPSHVDVDRYVRSLIRRFGNPAVRDPLSRLARRGSTKVPSYLLPSLQQAVRAGRPHLLMTLALAGWLRHLRGTDLAGRPVEVEDPLAGELITLARAGGADPVPVLARRELFGDLVDHDGFVRDLSRALAALDRGGVHAAISDHLYRATPRTT